MRNLIIIVALVTVLGVMGFLFQDQTRVRKTEAPKEEKASGEEQNIRDSIFNSALVVKTEEDGETKTATFNFVVSL